MIKNYSINGIGNNVEIGKNGCKINYSKNNNVVSINNSQSQLCKIDCSKGVNVYNTINVEQIENASITGNLTGSFSIDNNGDITFNTTISSININQPFQYINSKQTLEINKRYYIENDITVLLPTISNLTIGHSIEIRNKFGSSVTIEVNDTSTEQIYTDSTSSFSSILADVPSHYTFIFNGSDWEVL
ncbi:hypothetical protein PBI_SCTP2_163 [Salicola phage SCTP-2]|nr:hypothetical protein PBI_SCTP2_163 [Salicola phage SCTP-2]